MHNNNDPKYIILTEERAEAVLKECEELFKRLLECSEEETEHFKRLCIGYAIWQDQKMNQQLN